MGDIRFLCPECGSKLSIDSKAVGYFVSCPTCGKTIQVGQGKLLDIRFPCPECQGRLAVDIAAGGKTTRCPLCDAVIHIPQVPSGRQAERTPAAPSPALPQIAALTPDEVAFLTAES